MPGARAFRALRFTPEAGRLADLIAPPYDVINEAERERLASKGPHNIVRLALPEGDADPAKPGNRYERAGALMAEWRAGGVLAEEAEASLTIIREEFESGGRTRRRTGVQAAVRLDRYQERPGRPGGEGEVFPHERTLSGPRADRLALMRATRANLSPVFLLVPDSSGEIRSALAEIAAREPDHDIRGPDEARRRCWIERDSAMVERLEEATAGLPAVIADGHHRYETALAYRDEVAQAGKDPGKAAHVLCHIVPVEDEGLVVLPCHRMVKPGTPVEVEKLLAALGGNFELREITREEAFRYPTEQPAGGGRRGFVLAVGSPARLFRAELRDRAVRAVQAVIDELAPDRAEAWLGLDVSCLHLLVIEDVLGVTPDEVARGGCVTYTRDAEETVRAAESEGRLGFILRPVPPRAVLDVACAGQRMPQKSTYFHPKVAAGFAMRLLK